MRIELLIDGDVVVQARGCPPARGDHVLLDERLYVARERTFAASAEGGAEMTCRVRLTRRDG